jgi:hypothetical protein
MSNAAPAPETFADALSELLAAEAAWEAAPNSVPACTRTGRARHAIVRAALTEHYGVGAGVLLPKPYQGPRFDELRARFPLERDHFGRCCVFAERVPSHARSRFEISCPLHGQPEENHG